MISGFIASTFFTFRNTSDMTARKAATSQTDKLSPPRISSTAAPLSIVLQDRQRLLPWFIAAQNKNRLLRSCLFRYFVPYYSSPDGRKTTITVSLNHGDALILLINPRRCFPGCNLRRQLTGWLTVVIVAFMAAGARDKTHPDGRVSTVSVNSENRWPGAGKRFKFLPCPHQAPYRRRSPSRYDKTGPPPPFFSLQCRTDDQIRVISGTRLSRQNAG